MTLQASTVSAEEDLDALLMGLGLDGIDDAIIEQKEELVGETDLEAAVRGAESQDAINEHYESAEEIIESLDNPVLLLSGDTATPTEVLATVEDPAAAKVAKAAEKALAKAEKVAAKLAAKAAKAAKDAEPPKTAPVRKHYASKTARITDKLGDTLGDYTVLELPDAALVGDELAAKQQETLDALAKAGTKVQSRMTFLMEFAAGKTAALNGIAVTALTLLKKDGKITTGEKGNLLVELSKKYKQSSANAMGNNTLGAMRALKMIVGEKGEYTLNPQSLYALKINPMLGL